MSARRAPAGAKVLQLLLLMELASCLPPWTQHCQHHPHTIPRAPTPGALLASPLPASPCPLRHASLDVRLPPRIRTSRLENAPEDLPPPRTSSSRMVPNDVCRRPGRHDNVLVRNIAKKVTPPLGTHAHAPHTLSNFDPTSATNPVCSGTQAGGYGYLYIAEIPETHGSWGSSGRVGPRARPQREGPAAHRRTGAPRRRLWGRPPEGRPRSPGGMGPAP